MKKLLALTILITIFTGNYVLAFAPQYSANTGLKAYYSMDTRFNPWEAGTATATLLDSSGNSKNCLFYNSDKATNLKLGKVQQGIDFNGTDEYAGCTAGIIGDTDNFTVSYWMKFDGGDGGNMVNRGSDGYGNGWSMATGGAAGGSAFYCVVVASVMKCANGTSTIATSTWVHLTATLTQWVDIKLYVNGVQEAITTGVGAGLRNSTLEVMFCFINAGYCKGQIDEVKIWTRELSASEIREVYRQGLSNNANRR